jgi:hypothetical protein
LHWTLFIAIQVTHATGCKTQSENSVPALWQLLSCYAMDSQKVPGMVVLHCDGRTWSNAYLITFRVGLLHTHTHTHKIHRLAPCILPLVEAPAESFFWILPGLSCRIRFEALHGYESCSLEAHFRSREQPQLTRSEIRRVRWSGDDTISDVWLSVLSWCRITVPGCHLLRLSPNYVGQTLHNLHVELTNTNLRCTKPSMAIPGTFWLPFVAPNGYAGFQLRTSRHH